MRKTLVFILAATVLPLMGNQCAEYSLSVDQPVQKASTKGEFCSLPAVDNSTAVNIIFIVDMSGSNVRTLKPDRTGFDPVGTDRDGKRFDIIETFLSSDCAQANPRNKFAVVGFSSDVISATGTACSQDKLAVAGSSALNEQLDFLRGVQTNEMQDIATPDAMRSTRYEEGLECAQEIIDSHLSTMEDAEKKKNGYHVMFLSDGLPKTTSNEDVQDLSAILAVVDAIVASGRRASYAAVQPILYGASALGSELIRAREIMREIARKGTTVEEDVDNPESIDFCALLEVKKRTPYTVTDFGIVNLTAILRDGELLPDSDMDGIPDQEEAGRGFDPTKARSRVNGNEIMDGFCKTNAQQCSVYTDCGAPNAVGMTQCDVDFLSLSDGLDTDRDGLPDIVEMSRGTLPNTADQNSDVDGDGVINSLEVLSGSDPNRWDKSLDTKYLLKYGHYLTNESSSSCPSPQQLWKFQVDYVPIVPTLATRNNDPITASIPHRNHAAGENVILIYYIIRQANEQEGTAGQLYGQFIKLTASDKVELKQFRKLGNINGSFVPE